jgi:hypothetical protein
LQLVAGVIIRVGIHLTDPSSQNLVNIVAVQLSISRCRFGDPASQSAAGHHDAFTTPPESEGFAAR